MAERRSTHADRANHRARARVLAVVVAVTGIAIVAPASSAGASSGETCTNETYAWTGRAHLGDGTNSVDTGVGVPVTPGTRLGVVGTSADGIDAAGFARTLPVSVGGVAATAGATVPGGTIVISFDQGSPVDISGVTVVVQRCTAAASAAAAQPAAASPSGAAALPRTGPNDGRQLAIGAVLVAIGAGMVAAGRRRNAA